jgi:histidinol-phosphate aminotransferase
MSARPRAAVAALPSYRPGKGAAQAEAEHGITGAIKLASNETPWEPIPAVVEAITAAAAGANRYADHRATELRRALAEARGLQPEQVTVGCGSVGLLQQLLLAYGEDGAEILYPWRSFEVYPVYTRLVGAREVLVPLRDDTADVDALVAAITERTRLVLVANPNNPTGTAVPASELARLADALPDGALLVVDEAYHEFADPALGDPVEAFVGVRDDVVVLRTFSKAHGLAGLRVGYAMGDPSVIETIDKTLFPFAVNAAAQAAALAALAHEDEILERCAVIVAERGRVVDALRSAGHAVPEPQANFVWLPLGERTDEVYLALERLGVVTRPFSGEGIRVTIGSTAENDRFLSAYASVVGQSTG